MTRWFRFYDEALNDPKILKLSDNMYRIWVGILCVASKNDGALPPVDDLVLMLRMKAEKVQAALNSLVKSGLIDDCGENLSPHNWDKRQFKSDTSTERVKRFRNVTKAVSETAPETEQIQIQIQSRTESKIDAPPKAAPRVVKRALPLPIGWQPSVRAFELAEQHGQNVQVVESIFRDYLASSGKLYRDYDAAFHNFIRNQQSFNRGSFNGVRQSEKRGSIIDAADRAIAKLEREIAAEKQGCSATILSLPSQRLR